jgi:hypothetical protein
MAEYEREGHWRTLSNGTRTWVTGHSVTRCKQSVTNISRPTPWAKKTRGKLLQIPDGFKIIKKRSIWSLYQVGRNPNSKRRKFLGDFDSFKDALEKAIVLA